MASRTTGRWLLSSHRARLKRYDGQHNMEEFGGGMRGGGGARRVKVKFILPNNKETKAATATTTQRPEWHAKCGGPNKGRSLCGYIAALV